MTSAFAAADADRETWLRERRLGIGGSDVPALFGVDKWRTIQEVWLRKLNAMDEEESGEAAQWGHRLEGVVAQVFEERTGLKTMAPTDTLESAEYPWMRASIDRYVLDEHDVPFAVLEIKTRSSFVYKEWEEGPPPDVVLQLMHYLIVTGYRTGYIAGLVGGQALKIHEVEYDEELAQRIVEAERAFWELVIAEEPPDGPLGSLNGLIDEVTAHGVEEKKRQKLDNEIASDLRAYLLLRQVVEDGLKQMQEIEARVKLAMGNAGRGIVGNKVVATYLPKKVRELDAKRLQAERPLVAKQFTTTRLERELIIKKPKGGA